MRIVFAGTPLFAVAPLKALLNTHHEIIAVFTQPDRPAGRGRKLHPSPVKEVALEYGLRVFQPERLKEAKDQEILRELQPDLMVVVAYGLILPTSVLTIPTFGCINIHASLLPRWRGASPIQHAILAGDTTTGISIMQMDAGLDTGEVLLTKTCEINENETSQTLHDTLTHLGTEALLEVLDKIEQGLVIAVKQPSEGATYAHKILKEHANIQWQESALDIDRKIRAFNPWPIAFAHMPIDNIYSNQSAKNAPEQPETIRIWTAQVLHPENKKDTFSSGKEDTKKPGTILQANADGIDVMTGDGVLRILEMQLPGAKRLNVRDILHAKEDMFAVGKIFLS